jgi:tetratricopeptide (TPR) repeat protein
MKEFSTAIKRIRNTEYIYLTLNDASHLSEVTALLQKIECINNIKTVIGKKTYISIITSPGSTVSLAEDDIKQNLDIYFSSKAEQRNTNVSSDLKRVSDLKSKHKNPIRATLSFLSKIALKYKAPFVKIWKDPVWSKVISAGIISIFVIFVGIRDTIVSEKHDNKIPFISNKFRILILPFGEIESCPTRNRKFHWALHKDLEKIQKQYKLDIEIRRIDTLNKFISLEEAREIGKRDSADLVIWGDYHDNYNCDTTMVTINYENLSSTPQYNEYISDALESTLTESTVTTSIISGKISGKIEEIVFWSLGCFEYLNERYAKSRLYYKKVNTKSKHNYAYILLQIANTFKIENNIDSALVYYNEIIKNDSTCSRAYLNRADTYHYFDKFKLSVDDYTKALESENDPEVIYLIYCFRAHSYTHLGNYNNSQNDLDLAIKTYPKMYLAYKYKAELLSDQGKVSESLAVLKVAKELCQDESDLFLTESHIYHKSGDYKKAIKILDKAIKMSPSANYYSQRAHMRYHQEDYNNAKKDLFLSIELDSFHAYGYGHLALIYAQNNHMDEALKICNKGLKIVPYSELLLEVRLLYYTEKKQYDLVLKDLNSILSIDGSNIEHLLNRSLVGFLLNDYKQSIIDSEKVINLDSSQVAAYTIKGMSLGAEGNLNEASMCFSLAEQLNKNYYGIYIAKTYFYSKYEFYDNAIENMRILTEMEGMKNAQKPNETWPIHSIFLDVFEQHAVDILKKFPQQNDTLITYK